MYSFGNVPIQRASIGDGNSRWAVAVAAAESAGGGSHDSGYNLRERENGKGRYSISGAEDSGDYSKGTGRESLYRRAYKAEGGLSGNAGVYDSEGKLRDGNYLGRNLNLAA
ncbi:hypothetical protein COU60_05570 [Candidatus Pacearchaeota archaeon CG10_big_fil_rev_8_21_14_0_10_34_76]|nr:MAG: hypothetical protein COU60_05570 [Candidatus Pacearchaeota archaeon CG10_big_fil_rev_8_21_14_0_10_34_76]